MDDREIVGLYFSRSEEAIAETADKYGSYCHKISMNILSDACESEENVNDTYMQAWRSIPPERPGILSAFLGRICRNLALNKYKARRAGKRSGDEFAVSLSELDDCIPNSGLVEDEINTKELSVAISRFLRRQSADARRVFVKRYFYSESVSEISRETGFGESKVKSMLMRTRNRLQTALTEEGYYEK